ncbi:MAG: cytochrome c oxidase assembly protein [Sphingomonadaceae bacterium]
MTALVHNRNARTALCAGLFALAMLGLGYASVPLYRLFCQVTGLNGTTMRVSESAVPGAVAGKTMVIRFDANHASSLPWDFKPEVATQTVTIGARNIAFFTATNLSDKSVTGTATFNVTPVQTGGYFNKIQCFCFNRQTLAPGQTVRMPVIFFVDPKLIADAEAAKVQEITLSYTFYKVDDDATAS